MCDVTPEVPLRPGPPPPDRKVVTGLERVIRRFETGWECTAGNLVLGWGVTTVLRLGEFRPTEAW